MRILAFSNGTGSAWWRLESVARQINMKTDHEFFVFNSKQWANDIVESDIVVFQMAANPEVILQAQKQGARVVYEVDDLLLEDSDRKEITNNPNLVKGMIEGIKLADMVTTTTEQLREKLLQYNKNVIVLPNYIDTLWWGKQMITRRNNEIRIGWAGSNSHAADLEYIAPVMAQIMAEHKNVRFIHCGAGGVSGADDVKLMYGKDLLKEIPPDRREFYFGSSTDLWGFKSKTLHLDIALAPLVDDQFNACKSNIKWQEYSLNGWAGVYSDVGAYDDIKFAKKAKDEVEFFAEIKYLIENKKERKEMVKKAQQEILDNWTIDNHFMKWIKAYKSCLTQ